MRRLSSIVAGALAIWAVAPGAGVAQGAAKTYPQAMQCMAVAFTADDPIDQPPSQARVYETRSPVLPFGRWLEDLLTAQAQRYADAVRAGPERGKPTTIAASCGQVKNDGQAFMTNERLYGSTLNVQPDKSKFIALKVPDTVFLYAKGDLVDERNRSHNQYFWCFRSVGADGRFNVSPILRWPLQGPYYDGWDKKVRAPPYRLEDQLKRKYPGSNYCRSAPTLQEAYAARALAARTEFRDYYNKPGFQMLKTIDVVSVTVGDPNFEGLVVAEATPWLPKGKGSARKP